MKPPKILKPKGPCELYAGPVNKDGYGILDHNQSSQPVHGLAWEAKHGPRPQGYCLHHLCQNKLCRNPDHLQLVTAAEHMRIHKWLVFTGFCLRGHPVEFSVRCKECKKRAGTQWKKENPDAMKKQWARHYRRNKAKKMKQQRIRRWKANARARAAELIKQLRFT